MSTGGRGKGTNSWVAPGGYTKGTGAIQQEEIRTVHGYVMYGTLLLKKLRQKEQRAMNAISIPQYV